MKTKSELYIEELSKILNDRKKDPEPINEYEMVIYEAQASKKAEQIFNSNVKVATDKGENSG